MLPYNFAIIYHLSCYFANLSVGNKNTIFNTTHRRIHKLPSNVRRNIHRRAYKVSTKRRKLHDAIRCIIRTLSRQRCASKIPISGSGSNKKNTRSGRAFRAVRRRVVNLQFFTRSLRKISGRTAAVTVNRERAPKVYHDLCKFIHRHPFRVWRLTTIIQHNNDGSIRFNPYY